MLAALVLATAAQDFDAIWKADLQKGEGGAAVVSPLASWSRTRHGADARIPICSVTKLMTAQVAMQLVGEGKLRLDMPALEVLSWMPEWTAGITVERLLTHTSMLRIWISRAGRTGGVWR